MGRSIFLRHEQCPQCKDNGDDTSRDNLGVWSDGHAWCFKCGYRISNGQTLNLESLRIRNQETINKKNNDPVTLPSDYRTDFIAQVALDWLRTYQITDKEIQDNRFGWSKANESLVLPVFDLFGNLLMYQERLFGQGAYRKYLTRGFPDSVYHILGTSADCLVVVEDLLSAIKVGRVTSAMPLWCGWLSPKRMKTISMGYKKLVIWLDPDKAKDSVKFKQRALPFFEDVKAVITDQDPKCFTTEQIQHIISLT